MAVKRSSESPGTRGNADPPRAGSPVAAVFLTAFGVLVIAACAVLLSYNGIYQIAVQGNIDERYAHLYPASFTLLVLIALWTSYVLRTAPRSRRLWADALILALIALAAGASALQSADLVLVPDVALVVAAVAPWVALLVAFRLFLWVVMHLRGEIPGTRPRRTPRKEPRRDADDEEPDEEAAPAATIRQQDTQPLDGLLYPEPRPRRPQPAVPDRTRPPEHDEDQRPPRPREPEPADFREPGLHTPRPEPDDRPTRPEHPGRPDPAEHPEPSEPARPVESAGRAEPGEPAQAAQPAQSAQPAQPAGRGKRPGFFRRAVGGAGAKRRGGSRDEARPTPAEDAAEGSGTAQAADAEHSAPAGPAAGADADTDTRTTAPLWPNATSQPADSESALEGANGDEAEHGEERQSEERPAERPEERPAAAAVDAVDGVDAVNTGAPDPAGETESTSVPDTVPADEKGEDHEEGADAAAEPVGPDAALPSSRDQEAGATGADPADSLQAPGAGDSAPEDETAAERGASESAVAYTPSAAPAHRPDGAADSAADGPFDDTADGEPTAIAATAAATGSAALPKRTPGAAENPIKRAADTAPTAEATEPAESVDVPDSVSAEQTGTEADAAAVRPEAGEDGDGFVHDLPPGDPTSDEAEPAAAAPEPSAPSAADQDAALDRLSPGTDPHEPPRGPAFPAAPPIEKRPMVLKPRRSPRRSAASPFPEDPPSNRVRSEPKPPEE